VHVSPLKPTAQVHTPGEEHTPPFEHPDAHTAEAQQQQHRDHLVFVTYSTVGITWRSRK
jgi:hypothetical protein